jgi:hypothetical protein
MRPASDFDRIASNIAMWHAHDSAVKAELYSSCLPAKYCSDQTEMRCSLRKLLVREVERILFAHGTPILSRASQRLEALLISSS